MSNTATAARTATCKCGAIFELPVKRGRPPVSCLPCRMFANGPQAKAVAATAKTGTCTACGVSFELEVKRGRPHTKCPAHRAQVVTTALAERTADKIEAALTTDPDAPFVVDPTLYRFDVGSVVRLKAGTYSTDPDGRDSFVVKSVKLDSDGLVKHYECFGGDATDPKGVQMARSFAPDKLRPENRKHVLSYRARRSAGVETD